MMRAMTLDVFNAAIHEPAELLEAQGTRIDAAATLVANLRRNVIRDSSSGRPIIDIPAPEEPTRLAKGLATIACHHAAIFGREQAEDLDMQAAMRSALDSIPAARLAILQNVAGEIFTKASDIRELSGLPKNAVQWHTDELEALGVLKIGKTVDDERVCAFTKDFMEFWTDAGLG